MSQPLEHASIQDYGRFLGNLSRRLDETSSPLVKDHVTAFLRETPSIPFVKGIGVTVHEQFNPHGPASTVGIHILHGGSNLNINQELEQMDAVKAATERHLSVVAGFVKVNETDSFICPNMGTFRTYLQGYLDGTDCPGEILGYFSYS
ncbi:MAG: hypothetical protein ACHQT7_02765 [Candidatus Levyibacteriota bacterium]